MTAPTMGAIEGLLARYYAESSHFAIHNDNGHLMDASREKLLTAVRELARDAEAGQKLWAYLVETRKAWDEDMFDYVKMGLLKAIPVAENAADEERCGDCPGDCDSCYQTTDLLKERAAISAVGAK